jgi:hypothetical protein
MDLDSGANPLAAAGAGPAGGDVEWAALRQEHEHMKAAIAGITAGAGGGLPGMHAIIARIADRGSAPTNWHQVQSFPPFHLHPSRAL